jgi:hypothetical protein
LLEAENQVQATVVREEEARGKGHGHQYDSEEPAEEELQASVHKKPNVVKKASTRKLSVSQVVTESAPTSVPPQPEPAASSTEPHPDATLGEQFNETKDLLIQFHKKLRDTTEVSIFINVFQETHPYLRNTRAWCRPSDLFWYFR